MSELAALCCLYDGSKCGIMAKYREMAAIPILSRYRRASDGLRVRGWPAEEREAT